MSERHISQYLQYSRHTHTHTHKHQYSQYTDIGRPRAQATHSPHVRVRRGPWPSVDCAMPCAAPSHDARWSMPVRRSPCVLCRCSVGRARGVGVTSAYCASFTGISVLRGGYTVLGIGTYGKPNEVLALASATARSCLAGRASFVVSLPILCSCNV